MKVVLSKWSELRAGMTIFYVSETRIFEYVVLDTFRREDCIWVEFYLPDHIRKNRVNIYGITEALKEGRVHIKPPHDPLPMAARG